MQEKIIHIHDWDPILPASLGGQVRKVDLPRNFLYDSLLLMQTAIIVDDGGGGNPVYTEDAEDRMVDRVRVVIEGDTPIDIYNRLLQKAVVEPMEGVANDINQQTAGLAGATHTLQIVNKIPFVDGFAKTLEAKVSTMVRSWARRTFRFELTTPAALNEIMANPGVGAVALTNITYRLYAIVAEIDDTEKEIFDKALSKMLRITDDFEEWIAARANAVFNNQNLNRGHQALSVRMMVTDGTAPIQTRSQTDVTDFSLKIGDDDFIPARLPYAVQKVENVWEKETGFDAPNGIIGINLDKEKTHASAPFTTNLEDFKLWFTAIAPAATGRLDLALMEKAEARYVS